MQDLFYRIRLALFKIELARRRRRFQRYIDKRKENMAGAGNPNWGWFINQKV